MDKLKTNLEELKKFTEPLDRSKTITLGCHKTFAFREFKTVWFLHDALLAHTFQAHIKEVLDMKPENAFYSTVPANQYIAMGSNKKLYEIQVKLRGGK